MAIRNKVVHRFVKDRNEYLNEDGAFYYQIIPENVQAYSIKFDSEHPNDYTKCRLYYVLGTGGSTYAEIARGEGKDAAGNLVFSKEFLVNSENDALELINDFITESEVVVKYTELDESHKTILLANQNSISGKDTEGLSYNLVTVSELNVADFGSTGLHTNLNTKDKVTINNNDIIVTSADPVVYYTDIEVNNEKVQTIQLKNNQTLSALDFSGNNFDIAKISDTNNIELGNSSLHLNINSKNRITLNKKDTIAVLTDFEPYTTTEDLNVQLDTKLNHNLGSDNINKTLNINSDGEITPVTFGLATYDLSPQIGRGNTVEFIVPNSIILDDFILFYNGMKQNKKTYTYDPNTKIIKTEFIPQINETLDILYIQTK